MINNDITKRKQDDVQQRVLDNVPARDDADNPPKRIKLDLAATVDATQALKKQDKIPVQPHAIDPKPLPPHHRRLDSLARLIEGENICTAACRIGNEILITSNKAHALKNKFPDHKDVKYIQKILSHFKTAQSKESDINILSEIATIKISSLMKKNVDVKQSLQIDSSAFKKIAEYLYGLKTGMEWLKKDSLAFYAKFLSEEDKQNWAEKNEKKLTAPDKLALIKIKNKITGIQFVVEQVWRLVRDFKKMKMYFDENNDVSFKILAIGKENEHAEVRMIGYLLETGVLSNPQQADTPQATVFIGLSKLCCSDCARLINTVNQAFIKQSGSLNALSPSIGIQHENASGEQSLISSDELITAMSILKQIEQNEEDKDNPEENAPITTSGEHGLSFGKNWVTPLYMQNQPKDGKCYLGDSFYQWELTNVLTTGKTMKIDYAHMTPVQNIELLRQTCFELFQLPAIERPAIKADKRFISMTSVASGSPSSSPGKIDLAAGVLLQEVIDGLVEDTVNIEKKPGSAVNKTPSSPPTPGH